MAHALGIQGTGACPGPRLKTGCNCRLAVMYTPGHLGNEVAAAFYTDEKEIKIPKAGRLGGAILPKTAHELY